MSPGSQRILRERRYRGEGAPPPAPPSLALPHASLAGAWGSGGGGGSPGHGTGANAPFLLRMEQQLTSPGSSHGGAGALPRGGAVRGAALQAHACLSSGVRPPSPGPVHGAQAAARAGPAPDYPFRPLITPRAAARPPPSVEELSEGERVRRERRLAEARVAAAARELEGASFRPQLSAGTLRGQYCEVRARVAEARTAPELYLARIAEKQRRLDAQRLWREREKEVRCWRRGARGRQAGGTGRSRAGQGA
jgi:hypothetical protein